MWAHKESPEAKAAGLLSWAQDTHQPDTRRGSVVADQVEVAYINMSDSRAMDNTKERKTMRPWLIANVAFFVLVGTGQVEATPILQLYLEGGTYNTDTQSWELTPTGSSGGEPFRVWAIGNVDGPGGKGPISNVRLSVAYDEADLGLIVEITPSRAGGLLVGEFEGFDDDSIPISPALNTTVDTSLGTVTVPDGVVKNGGTPVLGDSNVKKRKNMPSHGIYGPGTFWSEYALGDFTQTDSPIGDFIDNFPTEVAYNAGQINVYEISVTGGSGATLHFDLYDTVKGATHASFAPFSHDVDADANIVPEPSAVAVWTVLGLIGVGVGWRRRKAKA